MSNSVPKRVGLILESLDRRLAQTTDKTARILLHQERRVVVMFLSLAEDMPPSEAIDEVALTLRGNMSHVLRTSISHRDLDPMSDGVTGPLMARAAMGCLSGLHALGRITNYTSPHKTVVYESLPTPFTAISIPHLPEMA